MIADLPPPVSDPDWSFYDEYVYIGKMYALDIYSVYMAEINKVVSKPRDSRQYDTPKHCAMFVKTGNNFDECGILKTNDFLKIHCILFSLFKRLLKQLQTYWSTA